MRSTTAHALTALGLGAVLLLPAGCKTPVVATRSGGTDTAAAPPSSGTTPTNPNHGSGAGGPGTVTVSITQPVAVSGHAGTTVTCDTGRAYSAVAQSATVDGYHVSFTVRAAGYRGPGTYQALVTARLDGASGAVTTVSAVPNIPAEITATGGSFSINATGDNGRTLAASLQWTCS